jgi:hypothetical protein
MARRIHIPTAITGLPDFMKREYLRAEIKRWGWTRMLFKWLMRSLGKYAGLHIYRVNKRPLGGYPGSPDLPSGISLAIVPPGKLGYAAEVGFSEISNYPSIAAAKFLGRRRVGFAGYVRCLGRRISFRTPGLKKLGFEFFEPKDSGR